MKKFFVVALAVIFCLALSMPAMAKVTLKGKLSVTASWESTDTNFQQNTKKQANDQGRDWFELDAGKSSSIDVGWVNDAGTLGLNANLGWFGDQEATAGEINGLMWGWYQINPMLKFSVGEIKSLIGGEGLPITCFQTWQGPFPAGNIIFNDVDSGLQLDAKVTDNVTLSFMISDNEAAGAWAIATPGNAWNADDEEETSPEFGFRLKARVGPFSFSPAYITSEKEYAWDAAAGAAITAPDSYTGWIATLPVKASIGPATITAEYNWGENLNAMSGWKGTLIAKNATPTVNATATGLDDGKYEGWFIGAMIKGLGPGILGFGYGHDETETGLAAARTVAEARTYGMRYIIPIVKGFDITPYYVVNDYDATTTGGIVNVMANGSSDPGEVDAIGVNFTIKF